MLDLGEIDARHDEAVLVGRKLNTEPLNEDDLIKLFKSCSDVPVLLAEMARINNRITEAEAVIVLAQRALTPDHPVWWVLDDYDGSMSSAKTLEKEKSSEDRVS